jgi:putative ABC transport system substrate-binding protein
LKTAGFAEGGDIKVEYRWAEDRFERLPALARELVDAKVAVIMAGGGDVSALAAKSATTTIPIVFAIGADPVQQGIVASLSRPGANITGATFLAVEIRPKMVELTRELLPNAKHVALLANPHRPGFRRLVQDVVKPAEIAGLSVRILEASDEFTIKNAFEALRQAPVDAVLIMSDPVYSNRRDLMARLQLAIRIPMIAWGEMVGAGGLIGYGAQPSDAYTQAGRYSGRILKGEKAGELPIVQPTKFELVINLKTAKELGVHVPATLLARADTVIE